MQGDHLDFEQTQKTPQGWWPMVFLMLWWLSIVGWLGGCSLTPGPSPASPTCLSNQDCTQGGQCALGVCIQSVTIEAAGGERAQEATGEPVGTESLAEPSLEIPPQESLPEPDSRVQESTPEPQRDAAQDKPDQRPIEVTPDDCVEGSEKTCLTGREGECKEGKQRCENGGWTSCVNAPAVAETCNGKDDDCDGTIDEICGEAYAYAVIEADGTFAKRGANDAMRDFKSSKNKSVGTYELDSKVKCSQMPIFMTPYSTHLHTISYKCDGDKYIVYTGEKKTKDLTGTTMFADVGFSVVHPHPKETRALVDVKPCGGKKPACGLTLNEGTTKVTQVYWVGAGQYTVESPQCQDPNQPIFVSLQHNGLAGYVSVTGSSTGSTICTVYTHNMQGVLVNDIDFAIWFPDPTKATWATIERTSTSTTNRLVSSLPLEDSLTKWGGQAVPITGCFSSPCERTQIKLTAWSSPSAVLVMLRSPMLLGGTSFHNGNSGQYAYTHIVKSPPSGNITQEVRSFSILYVQ